MSTDTPTDTTPGLQGDDEREVEVGSEERVSYRPREHGAALANVLDDLDDDARGTLNRARLGERGTLYERAIAYWRENVQSRDNEPWIAVEEFDADWLPTGDYAIVVTSSRWKAGQGEGDDYSAVYDQHLKLREIGDDGELRKPSLALHVEIMPQFEDLVYKDGNALETPYGEGTRLVAWSTWAGSPEALEARAYDALQAVYGDDAIDRDDDGRPADLVDESRRIVKAEDHIRFDKKRKNSVVATIDESKDLIDFGGWAEVDAQARRAREGWVEAKLQSNRWELLGFDDVPFSTEIKCYHTNDWHKRPETDPFAHPKLEASFSGAPGALPHAEAWDQVHDHLRRVVLSHASWSGVERSDLVADDFFDGPEAEAITYEHPTGRRDMLKARYEERETTIYKEALKESTTAVYDILAAIVEEAGATYDHLEEATGLARSTIRYHCRRLEAEGVVERIGNPVLVVFGSLDLLDRAEAVIKKVRPGESREERYERAQAREEAREASREASRDKNAGDHTREGENERTGEHARPGDDEAGDGAESDTEIGFAYLDALEAEFVEIAYAHSRGEIGDRDVRVRVDALPPELRA